ncbi:MAG: ISL3 family transposase [Spirochaetia bacterium]|jgi:transposase|nr:ISL3 family transposase [Spirochaetia bacterium]MCH3917377.1 ISL3 family transposase [Spirochaetia bacterium]MCH3918864.1 ISL3 family transposase [Spirochaetia bacterium]
MKYIKLPSRLVGFNNQTTEIVNTVSNKEMYLLHGTLKKDKKPCICPYCHKKMHVNNKYEVNLKHLCFGSRLSTIRFSKIRYRCPECSYTQMQEVPFQAKGHRISCELCQYTRDLLAYGFTNKEIAELTGLGKNTVKDIDLQRLKEKYTIDDKTLIKPERQARFLGIDEFKLHNGHKYAVVIIDMETGHILWLAHGKKKATVYAFIDHVGLDWMDGVEAIACDMNSDFEEAFEHRCPHIQPIFDFFHIKKNLNDKVVGEVRKDEFRRLIAEGDNKAAASLKKSRYILTSSVQTLQKKDKEAEDGKVISKGSTLFHKGEVVRKSGYVDRYEELIKQNKLLFTLDIIKEKLSDAYKMTDEAKMANEISEIMDICSNTKNKHFLWFYRLLDNHFEGIIAHATYNISAGKIEGINNKIKTARRKAFGYSDDEYFFLKLFDASRKSYVRNQVSHKILKNPQTL